MDVPHYFLREHLTAVYDVEDELERLHLRREYSKFFFAVVDYLRCCFVKDAGVFRFCKFDKIEPCRLVVSKVVGCAEPHETGLRVFAFSHDNFPFSHCGYRDIC